MSSCALLSGVVTVVGNEGLNELVPILIQCLQQIDQNAEDY